MTGVGTQGDNTDYLNMAAISGLLALRQYRMRYPDASASEAVSTLRNQFYDTAHFDYEAALELDRFLPEIPLTPTDHALQAILARVIEAACPWWLKLVPLGRERVLSVITRDQAQCFSSAGLTEESPSLTAVAWWDNLAKIARLDQDESKLAIGRDGEKLSLDHEISRLTQLGINRIPRWVSINDNTLGYDILSFERGPVEPVNRLIEVKAALSLPVTFHVTRNEWETAVTAKSAYVFHIWHLPSKNLRELSPDDLARHVPDDRGEGKWESFVVTLPD